MIGLCNRLFAFLFLATAAAASAESGQVEESLLAMRALDARVANIGHRLAVANVDLCTQRQWLPGFTVHDLQQYGDGYRDAAIRVFGLGEGPAVLAVSEGGPADEGGLQPDDVVRRLDGEDVPRGSPTGSRSFDAAERLMDMIDAAFADGAAVIEVGRGEGALDIRIEAERGCASRFQVVPARRLNALADGRYVQLTTAIAAYSVDDEELAAILAHEFAHNVLRHRARLDEAGAARGFLGNFGRSARLIREAEEEADRLSVYLLDRAGYDVEAPVRFWRRFGRHGLNFLGSATHPNWRRRITLFEAEIERIRQARADGVIPVPDFVAGAAALPMR